MSIETETDVDICGETMKDVVNLTAMIEMNKFNKIL